jgi:OHCU decarboxylase
VESIGALNALPRDEFAEALRPLFEAAAPLAETLYAARPFTTYAELIDTAESLAGRMSFADQVVVLAAHPRIGANPETVSATSYAEQGYSTESGTDPSGLRSVYEQLADLNHVYEQRFGFRFVVFVNRRTKAQIINVIEARLRNPREQELRTALREMFLIARDRLAALTAPPHGSDP